MRGLDGNYLNTQGDALARMQTAFQAEQNRQQIRAQMENEDQVRKLHETVNEPQRSDSSLGPDRVGDDGSSPQDRAGGRRAGGDKERPGVKGAPGGAPADEGGAPPGAHIDIRV